MKTEQRHDLIKDTEVFGVSLSLLISERMRSLLQCHLV
jgi:hypothetical protein